MDFRRSGTGNSTGLTGKFRVGTGNLRRQQKRVVEHSHPHEKERSRFNQVPA
jgi:hypothetical protein